MCYALAMKYIKCAALLLSLVTSLAAAPNYSAHLAKFEGYSDKVYLDSRGIKTVGYGTNIEARGLHYAVGARINSETLNRFTREDITKYESICRKYITNFDSLPDAAKEISFGLAYNVGQSGFIKFKRFRTNISARNFREATNELSQSVWAKQVKGRANSYIATLNNT